MKRSRSIVISLTLTLALVMSCATGFKVAKGPEADLMKEVAKINKAGGVAVLGTGIDTNGREDLALKKAVLDGRAQLGQLFETKMQVLEKKFSEEVGGNGNSELNEMFSSTTKAITKTTLNGSGALSTPITKTEGSKITIKVIVGIDPKTLNSSIFTEMQKSKPALYERFRASQSFKELGKEMDEYDSSGSK